MKSLYILRHDCENCLINIWDQSRKQLLFRVGLQNTRLSFIYNFHTFCPCQLPKNDNIFFYLKESLSFTKMEVIRILTSGKARKQFENSETVKRESAKLSSNKNNSRESNCSLSFKLSQYHSRTMQKIASLASRKEDIRPLHH